MSSVGSEFPKEQERVREILGQYKAAGRAGAFGAACIENSLKMADEALASKDIVKMVTAFKDLQSIQS